MAGAVTTDFFPLLGVQPAFGRNFTGEEDTPNGPRAAILGHGLWQSRFGGDADVLGRTITLNEHSYTVVGILPARFQYPEQFQLWIPLALGETGATLATYGEGMVLLKAIARLKPGVTLEQAQTELQTIAQRVQPARSGGAKPGGGPAAMGTGAGVDGVLQQIGDLAPLQVGQRVTPAATLAKIVEPTRLKAVLRIPETQVRDVQLGQKAEIDTRNGLVPGQVVRIDPAAQNGTVTVDVKLEGALPKGARPDLNVDGVIELERLESVLYVGRPVQGQADSAVGLYKVLNGGTVAQRVPVKLGRCSVSAIEVVEGLQVGDQVILSDMAAWDGHERVRLQ